MSISKYTHMLASTGPSLAQSRTPYLSRIHATATLCVVFATAGLGGLDVTTQVNGIAKIAKITISSVYQTHKRHRDTSVYSRVTVSAMEGSCPSLGIDKTALEWKQKAFRLQSDSMRWERCGIDSDTLPFISRFASRQIFLSSHEVRIETTEAEITPEIGRKPCNNS